MYQQTLSIFREDGFFLFMPLKKASRRKKDAKRMFSVCSILIGPPILITRRDEGGSDDINKSAHKNAGNYAHHHHSPIYIWFDSFVNFHIITNQSKLHYILQTLSLSFLC
ncbi:hypothetical protein D3C81_207910 [compost metagenome]